MRLPCATFALLLLLTLAFAAQSPLQRFINKSFEPDQAVSSSELLPNRGIYLIVADGQETYLFNSSSGKHLSDSAAMSSVLLSDLYNRTDYSRRADSLLGLASEARAAKQYAESKCMQYVGVNMHPCIDKQTCTVACFAVPQCGVVVQSDGFIDAMMQWNAGRLRFDSLLLEYEGGIEAISSDPAAIEAKRATLASLVFLGYNLTDNAIFLSGEDPRCTGKNAIRCYEYCPLPDYSMSRMESARGELLGLSLVSNDARAQPARAASILSRSTENEAYLAKRGREFEEFRIAMNLSVSNLSAKLEEFEKSISDPLARQAFDSLSYLSGEIIQQADSGFYRKALSRRNEFALSYSNVSYLLSHELSLLSLAKNRISSIEKKLSKSGDILSNDSLAYYSTQVGSAKANLAGIVPLSDLQPQLSLLSSLEQKLDSEIADKTVAEPSSPITATKEEVVIKVPTSACLPGLALLSLASLALLRRT